MATDTERIKERLDLVDVVNEYVRLKPAGTNHKARCPFHQEKTPSFMVNRERQFWHCFGCGRGGDVFSFIQDIEGMEFPEALRLLAKRAGVELTRQGRQQSTVRTRLLDLMKWATAFFMKQLTGAQGDAARTYLEERGIDSTAQEMFGIGFAPDSWEHASVFLKEKGFSQEEIFHAGLTVKSEKRDSMYERFRNRIMFPIADVHGSVVGFGGRTLDEDEPAKYINSPQTPVYDKSRVLYGLHLAKSPIREAGAVVLVEGYTDVIASHRAGVRHVAGVSGTALTHGQLSLLKRFTNTIIVAFDADIAGEAAAARGLELALEAEMEIKAIRLPEGKDPDELVRKSPQAWKKLVEGAQAYFAVLFDQLMHRHGTETVEGKKALTKSYLTAVAKIADPVERQHYLEKLARAVHVDVETLASRLPKQRSQQRPRPATQAPQTPRAVQRSTVLLEELLALLMNDPESVGGVAELLAPEDIPEGDLRKLYTIVVSLYTQDQLTAEKLAEEWEHEGGGETRIIDELGLRFSKDFADFSREEIKKSVTAHARELKKYSLEEKLKSIERELKVLEARGEDEQRIEALVGTFRELTEQLRDLS